jgi:hypothetical protein
MHTKPQITAARRYAPPLLIVARVDRRGAKLRQVNRCAVDYARRAGLAFEDVYPGGTDAVRRLAPPKGTHEAKAFARATGLSHRTIFGGEAVGLEEPLRWRWRWAAVGAIVGAAFAGPIGAVAGGLIGGTR